MRLPRTFALSRTAKTVLSASVSVAILWVLIHQGVLGPPSRWIPDGIALLGTSGFLVLSLLPMAGLASASIKWHIASDGDSLRTSIGLHWASEFASLFGLGSLGGDGYKVVTQEDKRDGLRKVFLIRIVGVGVYLLLLALIITIRSFVALLPISVALTAAVYLYRRRGTKLGRTAVKLILVTMIHIPVASVVLLLALGHQIGPNFSAVTVLHLAASLASAIPFSYQGVGFREAAFSIVGVAVAGEATDFARLGVTLSAITIAVRLLGVVPFSSRMSQTSPAKAVPS